MSRKEKTMQQTDVAVKQEINIRTSINSFSFHLHHVLTEHGATENMTFSPFNLYILSCLIYAGASGQTREELAEMLGLPVECDPEEVHRQVAGYLSSVYGSDMDVHNAVWLQSNYNVLQSFTTTLSEMYESEVKQGNFQGDASRVEREINSWASEMTRGKIPSLIPRGTLDAMVKAVLVSTVYFKSNWVEKFSKKKTHDEVFWLNSAEGKKKTVKMMHASGKYRYWGTELMTCVQIAYAEGRYFLLIVPDKYDDLDNVVAEWNDFGNSMIEQMYHESVVTNVQMHLPRFTVRSKLDLKGAFMSLGVVSAFGLTADFSNLVSPEVDDIYISALMQETVVETNEEGTEAAAASFAVARSKSFNPNPVQVVKVRADHPFMFMIVDDVTRTILFTGEVRDPEE